MKARQYGFLVLLAWLALVIGGCSTQPSKPAPQAKAMAMNEAPQVEFTLMTSHVDGKMVYLGAGGEIDGLINPDLFAQTGDSVHIVIINGDGMPHDLAIPDLNAKTTMVVSKDQTADVTINVEESGIFAYFCTVPGHREAGMEGKLVVGGP